jgi:hypothetical protein
MVKNARKGIGFDILGTRAIREREVKTSEKECPPRLPGVESLGGSDIFQIFVIGPNYKRYPRTL